MRPVGIAALAFGVSMACGGGGGGNEPPGIDAAPAPYCVPGAGDQMRLVPILDSGLEHPVYLTAPASDPRLFVVEQPGRIRVIKDGVLLGTPYLDINDLVTDGGDEQGLLGLAFHPQFASNGRFFVHYSEAATSGGTVIAEYHATPDADTASTTETRLLTHAQPADNHNGGMIQFGPDGYLYISLGDGGGANNFYGNGQNPDSQLAKILRIDVDSGSPYGIPSDNPWASGGGVPEMYAWGLRNPWRMSVDSNGDLYIGDVGQGHYEEVDVMPASRSGDNFGWAVFEGPECFADDPDGSAGCALPGDYRAPTVAYDRTTGNDQCSVVGGFVYRGGCMPDLVGTYFYGDYCSGEINTFVYAGGQATQEMAREDQIDPSGLLYQQLSSFGLDGYGELYVTAYRSGAIYRIELE